MTHLAVDLALAGVTGVCWGTGPHDHDTFQCPSKLRGGERLSWIRRRLAEHLDAHREPRITALVVEAPFMSNTHPKGAIPLIKLHGAVEHMAHVKRLTHHEVMNHILKQYATGKGNANKDLMLAAALDLGYDVEDHNAADAIHLWRFWQQRERGAA